MEFVSTESYLRKAFHHLNNLYVVKQYYPSNVTKALTVSFPFRSEIKYGARSPHSVGSVAFKKASILCSYTGTLVQDEISRDYCWFFSLWRTESVSPFTQRLPASAGSVLGEILIKTSSARHLTPTHSKWCHREHYLLALLCRDARVGGEGNLPLIFSPSTVSLFLEAVKIKVLHWFFAATQSLLINCWLLNCRF